MAIPRLINIQGVRTYATRENAEKAVAKAFGDSPTGDTVIYFIHTGEDGRFFPVFVGQSALQNLLHFKFNVVA